MNDTQKKELLDLAETLKGIADGKPWEASRGNEWNPYGGTPTAALYYGHKIRLKPWTLPPAPEGREWHRGAEFIEADLPEGYRPLLVREVLDRGDEAWTHGEGPWAATTAIGETLQTDWHTKCRTKRPLPEPDPVPLGPEDVPPGSSIRGAAETESAGWCLITSCSRTGIRIWRHSEESPHEITWEALKESGSQILRPGQDWQPCHKDAP